MPGIARAFTTRRVKLSLELAQEARERAAREKAATMQRSNTTKEAATKAPPTPAVPSRPSSSANDAPRPKISGPVELIHTTNMLSYNAPDLPRPSTSSQGSTKSSTHSDNDSDSSPGTALSSPPTSPDVSPRELKRSPSPEPNHLSCYFMPPQPAQDPHKAPIAAPAIPQRAPSHTKQASMDAMTRQNSGRLRKEPTGRSMPRSNDSARSSANSTTASPMSHRSFRSQSSIGSSVSSVAPAHPAMPHAKPQLAGHHAFGPELAQVTEIAEEFGVGGHSSVIDEEERELISQGLCKFSADVYLHDIQTLASIFFHDRDVRHSRPTPAVWI